MMIFTNEVTHKSLHVPTDSPVKIKVKDDDESGQCHRAAACASSGVPRAPWRGWRHLWLAFMALAIGGCEELPIDPPRPTNRGLPTYAQVVERYNRNLRGVDQVWSVVTVSLSWLDDGKRRYEQGDGQLAVRMNDALSLTVGKAGHDIMRAGCNRTLYWLFDLHSDVKVLRFGRHGGPGSADGLDRVFPIQPRDLVRLLGLVKIDPVTDGLPGTVEWFGNLLLVEPAKSNGRLLVDPATMRPVRIDLKDEQGYSYVKADLAEYEPLQTAGVGPGSWPLVPTRITITHTEGKGSAKMTLSEPVGDREAVNPAWFDLKRLTNALQPDAVIDLDGQTAP
jgi:hypothetical protein